MAVWIPIAGIVAVNVIPLIGAIWLGWSVFELVLLFWFENVAIGIVHFLRMWICAKTNMDSGGRGTALFFALHYGIFTFVHGVFVIVLFGVLAGGLAHGQGGVAAAMIAVLAWQFLSLGMDYFQTEGFRGQSNDTLMFQPYPRIFALHITVIAAGWFIAEAGSPLWALILLVFLKSLFDFAFWGFTPQANQQATISALRKGPGKS